jgi:hypothetical protein
MLIRHSEQLILAALAGAILMLCACIGFDDFKMAAHAAEKALCKDEPDRKAYMARLPAEAHSTEFCLHAFRFGSPSWVPELGHPLQPRRAE